MSSDVHALLLSTSEETVLHFHCALYSQIGHHELTDSPA